MELAGALADIAQYALKHEFRHINPADAHIVLVEAGDRVLGAFPPELSAKAQAALEKLGVKVRLKTQVTSIDCDHVMLDCGGADGATADADGDLGGGRGRVAAGQEPRRRDRRGARSRGADRGGAGSVAARASGDFCARRHGELHAPGRQAAARRRARGDSTGPVRGEADSRPGSTASALPKFRYRELGNLATIGRSAAVADFGRVQFSGFVAWVLWLFIHLMNIVNYRNRILVFLQWALELSHARPLGAADHRRRSEAVAWKSST